MLQIRPAASRSAAPEVAPSPALWQLGITSWLGRFPVLERRRTEFGLWWGGRTPREAGMEPRHRPGRPSMHQLQDLGRRFPPNHLHESWLDYLYWDIELEP